MEIVFTAMTSPVTGYGNVLGIPCIDVYGPVLNVRIRRWFGACFNPVNNIRHWHSQLQPFGSAVCAFIDADNPTVTVHQRPARTPRLNICTMLDKVFATVYHQFALVNGTFCYDRIGDAIPCQISAGVTRCVNYIAFSPITTPTLQP